MGLRRYTVSTRSNRAPALLITLLALLSTPRASAQEVRLIDQFIGTWEGQGKLFGADAAFSMEWDWVLEQQFVRLIFQNKMKTPAGEERIFRARAFYRPIGAGRFEGTWFDSRGMVLPLQGTAGENSLTTLWGTPETEQGRTVYRLLDESHLEVEDSVLQDGQWHQFGHALYERLARSP